VSQCQRFISGVFTKYTSEEMGQVIETQEYMQHFKALNSTALVATEPTKRWGFRENHESSGLFDSKCCAIGSPVANAGAMGSSAVGAKIAQNVFGRRDRQPGGECRRDGQRCSRLRLEGAIGSPV